MMLFDLFRNYLNALVGRNQEFEKLLAAKDISAVKERMGNRMDMAIAALKEYEVTSHEIMKREDNRYGSCRYLIRFTSMKSHSYSSTAVR
jgi:hypothetical protein